MSKKTRRNVLATAGTIGTLSLAGCISGTVDDRFSIPSFGSDNDGEPPDPSGDDAQPAENGSDEPAADDRPGESIDDFEDLDHWFAFVGHGDIAPTTEDAYHGAQSAHIEADADAEYAGVYREFVEPLDLHDQNLSLAVKYTGRELFDLHVQVLAPNSRNYLGCRRVLTGPQDRWTRIDLGANYRETQPDLHDVREIRIIGRRRADDSGSIEFAVDDLRATQRPDTGAVMLLFDGTLESHYTSGLEIMDEYGFAGVECVTPETVGRDGRLTLDQLREMNDAGWEMISRPRVGGQFMHEYSVEEQEGMIRRTQTYLRNRGFEDGASHFFTPRNVIGPDGMDLVREYHELAFRYGGGPNALPVTDPQNLGHFTARDLEDAMGFIDLAAEYRQLAIPRIETIGQDDMDEDDLHTLFEHIDAADVRVLTASDVSVDGYWA